MNDERSVVGPAHVEFDTVDAEINGGTKGAKGIFSLGRCTPR